MPRDARLIPPEGFLHVYSRGNNRRILFFRPKDFKIYYSLLTELKRQESVKIMHYCLMANHVHLLVRVSELSGLSSFMQRLNLQYFYYYRKQHAYVGHLWQNRFKSKLIQKEDYLIQCGKYIELNPIRAGIVKFPQDYPYSSYPYYAFGREDAIVDMDPLYIDLGKDELSRQANYQQLLLAEASKIIA